MKAVVQPIELPMADLRAEPAIFHREVTVGFGRSSVSCQRQQTALRPKLPSRKRAADGSYNQQAVKEAVECNFEAFDEQGVQPFMEQTIASLPEATKKNLVELEATQAAIIYELLSKCHEK